MSKSLAVLLKIPSLPQVIMIYEATTSTYNSQVTTFWKEKMKNWSRRHEMMKISILFNIDHLTVNYIGK